MYEGATVMENPHGRIELSRGEYAFAPRDRSAAPRRLDLRPGFLKHRTLRLEDRIQSRKERLATVVQRRLQKKRADDARQAIQDKPEPRRPHGRRNP